MSRSAFADEKLAGGALAIAALFLWMKTWQSIFCSRMRATILHEPVVAGGWRVAARAAICQAVVQPSGLFLLPICMVLTIPFGWVYAFYQNSTALADGETDLKTVFKESLRQSALWPHQNHSLIFLITGFSICVFLNWMSVCFVVPALFKMLFGTDSAFTRSGLSLLNTTFFMVTIGLTYLSVDPVVKAVYALRCFYGLALKSGEDLKAELRMEAERPGGAALSSARPATAPAPRTVTTGLVILVCAAAMLNGSAVAAAEPSEGSSPPANPVVSTMPPASSARQVSPEQLDQKIREVLERPKYAWRMPREKAQVKSAEKGVFGRFLEKVGNLFKRWGKATLDWLNQVLRKLFGRRSPAPMLPSGYGWITTLKLLLAVLVTAAVAALVLLFYRIWTNRVRGQQPLASQAINPAPDLNDENVSADQLPEDGWMQLARDLIDKGDLRLALRALYLASLSHLAERHLLTLARSKSNGEYARELARRAHAIPSLREVFEENLSSFERIWYGMHEISADLVNRFSENVRRMREGTL